MLHDRDETCRMEKAHLTGFKHDLNNFHMAETAAYNEGCSRESELANGAETCRVERGTRGGRHRESE